MEYLVMVQQQIAIIRWLLARVAVLTYQQMVNLLSFQPQINKLVLLLKAMLTVGDETREDSLVMAQPLLLYIL